ncbi:ABC transporter-type lipoprotein-releasing protein [Methylophilales bacterium HTCC2181]|uniref:ABC transporter-type lipoprotein-releasing protein n=1 Tax=Methylophilales bacterium HTCC2181 TaxID=383631 RepID=A0P7Q3_9PROT|nr:ABC transporter-type lipoprotein-releasing protein [Methylophilales bacterium HTCC2181]|tara:strand:- start:3759 stop:4436 length:678 start_codon:yes stop_codon:yes gene_type:complete
MNKSMILNLIDLSKVYAGLDTPILNKINLCLFQGENIAITGVSGSGKSTLLHLMAGLDIPSKGSVEIDNKNLATLNQSQLAVMRNVLIGFVYQAHHLLPDFTALENILMPLIIKGGSYEQGRNQALKILKTLGLTKRAEHYPHQLSGGEKQRVAIGRALITEPKLILADEPTGNLDHKNAKLVFEMFLELADELKSSIVLVTHDLALARKMKKIYYLNEGTINSR